LIIKARLTLKMRPDLSVLSGEDQHASRTRFGVSPEKVTSFGMYITFLIPVCKLSEHKSMLSETLINRLTLQDQPAMV
jgi:hypothetical protein